MNDPSDQSEESLPPSKLRKIGDVCRRFESAWHAGQKPTVEEYLRNHPDCEWSVLERNLTALLAQLRGQQREE